MPTKYYHAENCNRRFEHGVEFKPYSLLGGTWNGLFATESHAQQEYLTGLAINPSTAVREITEEEYTRRLAMTNGVKDYSPIPDPFKVKPAPKPPAARLAAKAGVVVNDPEPRVEEQPLKASEPLPSVSDALVVDTVEKAGEVPALKPSPAAPKKKAVAQ